jgi:hypothetical protein
MFRIILIVLAAFVLFALINYYNSKQTTAQSQTAQTERFYQSIGPAPVISAPATSPVVGPPPVTGTGSAGAPTVQATSEVQPSEDLGSSSADYRAVDYATNKLPSDCFPRDRLTAEDLLPSEAAANSTWAQVNPAGQGDVSNQNFLTAGWSVGINTVAGSLRNANLQLRSEPPNPRGAWPINNSTISNDLSRRPLEIAGDCDL